MTRLRSSARLAVPAAIASALLVLAGGALDSRAEPPPDPPDDDYPGPMPDDLPSGLTGRSADGTSFDAQVILRVEDDGELRVVRARGRLSLSSDLASPQQRVWRLITPDGDGGDPDRPIIVGSVFNRPDGSDRLVIERATLHWVPVPADDAQAGPSHEGGDVTLVVAPDDPRVGCDSARGCPAEAVVTDGRRTEALDMDLRVRILPRRAQNRRSGGDGTG